MISDAELEKLERSSLPPTVWYKLIERLRSAEAALKFYGDPVNWETPFPENPLQVYSNLRGDRVPTSGSKARAHFDKVNDDK